MCSQYKSWRPYIIPNDPCKPIEIKSYATPPHLYIGLQPYGLPQFKTPKEANRTIWRCRWRLRYMNQRYTIPDKVVGLLTEIATEEFSHLEMIATMIYKLTKDATPQQLKEAGLGEHYVNHDSALFYLDPKFYKFLRIALGLLMVANYILSDLIF